MIDVRVPTLQIAAERFANLSRDPLVDETTRTTLQLTARDLYGFARHWLDIQTQGWDEVLSENYYSLPLPPSPYAP